MILRRLIPFILLIILFSGCIGGKVCNEPYILVGGLLLPDGYSIYQRPAYMIRFQYPSDWLKKDGLMGTIVTLYLEKPSLEDDFGENLMVMLEDTSAYPDMSIEMYPRIANSNMAKMTNELRLSRHMTHG